jgi:hypothetical protein
LFFFFSFLFALFRTAKQSRWLTLIVNFKMGQRLLGGLCRIHLPA